MITHHQYPCTHARTHTQHKRPKRSNRNWKQILCAPQNLPKFSLQVSFSSSSFTSTGQSIFSCCWRSQVRPCAAAINAPCPTGDYRHHRVSQQPSIAKKTSPSTTENASQSLQNPTRKKNWRKNQWGASTWCLPSQPLLASMRLRTCQQDRSPCSVGRSRTSTPSAPHVHTNFAWFQSYSTRNLRTRNGHPPEVASQLMHPSIIVRRPKWRKSSKTESCWYRRVNEQFLQKWLRKSKRNLVAKKARTYEWVIVTYGRFLVDRRAPRVTKVTCTFWSQQKARETL